MTASWLRSALPSLTRIISCKVRDGERIFTTSSINRPIVFSLLYTGISTDSRQFLAAATSFTMVLDPRTSALTTFSLLHIQGAGWRVGAISWSTEHESQMDS